MDRRQYNLPLHSVPVVRARLYKCLIIGYGNTLRSDDGVGPRVADTVAAWNFPGVKVITCGLLTPELADAVSQAKQVVFVDASVEERRVVQFRELQPADSSQIMAHAADPRTLLALARDVFGHAPPAWWFTIPAENLGFGEGFSALAQTGVEEALAKIRMLLESGKMDRAKQT
jgi:hydrogenase maturation protease